MWTAQAARRPLLALSAATAAHLLLRLALVAGRQGPINFADESGYLANARVLAGGGASTLDLAAFYRGGYSLLLVPAVALGRDPVQDYRLVLATNALLSTAVVPLLYVVLRRVFAVPPGRAVAAAAAAGAYPPLVVTTQMAWTESLLPPLVLLAALAVARCASGGRPLRWGATAGLAVGALWAVHGRSAPLVAAALLVLATAALRRPPARLPAAVAAATATAALVASALLNRYLLDASWGGHRDRDVDRVLAGASGAGAVVDVAALGAGQVWYLVVATFGLVVPGAVALVAAARRPRDDAGASATAWFVLLSLAGCAVLVGLFLSPASRPDHVVYGRYAEVLLPPVLALGLLRLWQEPRRTAVETAAGLGLAAVLALALEPYRDGLVSSGPVNWLTVLALRPLAQPGERLLPAAAVACAVVGAAVVVLVSRRRPALGAALLVLASAGSATAVRATVVGERDALIHRSPDGPLRAVPGLVGAQRVGYDMAAYDAAGLYAYQWLLEGSRFVLFDSRRDPVPPTAFVVAGTSWAPAPRVGAVRVWSDADVGQAVWRLG